MTTPRMHQIGEVADTVGLSLRTIRHWDEVDLAPPSGRSAGGFRLYTDDDIARLRLVKSLKPLELSLDDMRDLLAVRDQLRAEPTNADRRVLLERLATYSAVADERCEHLREQLSAVEGLAGMLRTEADTGEIGTRVPR